jgi:pimeloyl-ACP methyl ester carboxylesterase
MPMKDVSVVLAHGGWADGSSWSRVITGLAGAGIKAIAAPLPLTSLAEDVAALNRSIARVSGPVVLAAHAYAGAVIGLVRPERVKALVYVTAFAPDEGETLKDLFYRAEPHPQAPMLAPECVRGRPGRARGRAAAALHHLHDGSGGASAVEGRSELVSGGRAGPHDRPGHAAHVGRAHEGQHQFACRRSHADRDCSGSGRRHHP